MLACLRVFVLRCEWMLSMYERSTLREFCTRAPSEWNSMRRDSPQENVLLCTIETLSLLGFSKRVKIVTIWFVSRYSIQKFAYIQNEHGWILRHITCGRDNILWIHVHQLFSMFSSFVVCSNYRWRRRITSFHNKDKFIYCVHDSIKEQLSALFCYFHRTSKVCPVISAGSVHTVALKTALDPLWGNWQAETCRH